MHTEEIHIGLTAKTSKVVDTIEFEEEDLIREGLGHKYFNGELDLHRRNYYIGEWLVDLWGRDEAGTLISECSFGGFAEAEWEGETSLDILRFWKLTKVEEKVKRGRLYYVIYSGKRHWDIDEELYQREEDFLPVLFSLATEPETDVEFEADGVWYLANDFHSVAVVKPRKKELYYKGRLTVPPTVTFRKKKYTVNEIQDVSDCHELTEVILPDTITEIDDDAFNGCRSMRTINFPDSLEVIGEKAFWGCVALERIALPDKFCWVSKHAFAWCEGLKEISFTRQVTIAEETFAHCKSMETLVLPPTVQRLEPGVFRGCTRLKTVILNEGLNSFYGNDFADCPLSELRIPKTVTTVYGHAGDSVMNIYVNPENEHLCSVDGVLYSKDMRKLEQCPRGREGEFVIPAGVECISGGAFYGCSRITKVVMPDSVWDVGYNSFFGCKKLQTVIMGNGVEVISREAFANCESLSTVVFGTGLDRIEERAFYNCKALTKVDLPDSIKHYNLTLFENCTNLTELTMPEWMEKRRAVIMDYARGKKTTGRS